MKKLMTIITTLIIALTSMTSVSAASNPSSIVVTSMGKYNYGGEYSFPVKYATTTGVVTYCINYTKYAPMGHTMTDPTKADAGLTYILDHGYKGTFDDFQSDDAKKKEYYITQLAIHTYLGQAKPKANNEIHKKVWDLVNGAKNAKNTSTDVSMSLTGDSSDMKLKGDYFVSGPVNVSISTSGSFPITASKNVNAQVVDANGNVVNAVKSGDTVYLRMPQSSISDGQTATVNMTVSGVSSNKTAYYYIPGGSDIQEMLYAEIYSTPAKNASAKYSAKATKVSSPKESEVVISKQDITNKQELPGATLVIKDANGETVSTWVSTNTPKSIKGLKEGSYTLCETIAPDGYVLSTECIDFKVYSDGTVSKVTMYNTPKKDEEVVTKEKVKISKQDITTKSELPGATLVIRDASGKEIKRWVSTTTATYVELAEGTYTLEEIQAPNGYVLSTEKIEFTVNELGVADKEVIMYNTPEVDVPITDADASIIMYGIGLFGLMFGFKKIAINA